MAKVRFDLPDGTTFRTVSREEAEASEAVVCLPKSHDRGIFTDNVVARCHDCRCEIIHRPDIPKTPIKLCIECAYIRTKAGHA